MAAKRYCYRNTLGQYVTLRRGKDPDRLYHDDRPATVPLIQAPPTDGDYPQDEYYLGRRRQWRVTAHVEFDLDRQGVHLLYGLLAGLILADQPLAGGVLAGVFGLYEVRESGSVNDLDWIDIGAFAVGQAVGYVAGRALMVYNGAASALGWGA